MSIVEGMRINESEYDLANGEKGKIAVFLYNGDQDPKSILDYCVKKYVENNNHYELIDAQLNCPWVRVVLSNINDMKQCNFATRPSFLSIDPSAAYTAQAAAVWSRCASSSWPS